MSANKVLIIKPEKLSPRIRRLRGIIKIDEGLDYKKILIEELEKEYKKEREDERK